MSQPRTRTDRSMAAQSAHYLLAVLLFANLVSYLARFSVSLVVQPVKTDLAVSDTAVSLLQGLSFTVFFVLVGLPCGWLVDRVNRRNLLLPATLLWCAMAVLGGLAHGFGQLFLSRVFLGIGEAAVVPAGYSMLADSFPPAQRGKAIGLFMAAGALGVGFGTIGGGLILKVLTSYPDVVWPLVGSLAPWRAFFCMTAIPGLLAAALLLTIKEPARNRSVPPDGRTRSTGFYEFLVGDGKALLRVYGSSALTMIAFYALVAWSVALFGRRYHWDFATAGVLVGAIHTVVGFLAMSVGGVLGDRLTTGTGGGRLRLVTPTLVAAIPGFALLCLAPPGQPLLAAVGLLIAAGGLYMSGGAFYPSIQDIAPSHFRGQAVSFLLLANNLIGATLGPTITAVINDHLFHDADQLGWSLLLTAVPALLGALAIIHLNFADLGAASVLPVRQK